MKNLLDLVETGCEQFAARPCVKFKTKKGWKTWNWTVTFDKIMGLAQGLLDLGVKAGDKIAILSNTRVEWTLADIAIISLGGVTVPVYQSSLGDQIQYILDNAEVSGIFVENDKQLAKVLDVLHNLPRVQWIVVFEPSRKPEPAPISAVYALDEVLKKETTRARAVFAANRDSIPLDREMSYVYTSGTTGNPKGVILTHRNFVSNVLGMVESMGIKSDWESLLFLPLSHIMARLFQFLNFALGCVQAYAENIDRLFNNIQEVRPHFMVCVPRIFEKVHEKVMSDAHRANPVKKALFTWATDVGMEAKGLAPRTWSRILPGALRVQHGLASLLVHRKLQEKLGGRLQFLISGGAPLSYDIAKFFYAFGILILEGYGLTETTAPVALNRPDRFKLGTVGPAVPGCEIRIAKDGEILVKGGMVFKGYYKNERATKDVFHPGDWFATGDIGELDAEGFLKITDRKKDIIVTSGGKNIAPQNIENTLKTIPMVSQVMVHGDKRKFLSALIVLDPDALKKFAERRHLQAKPGEPLWESPSVHKYIKDEIEKKNKELASYETIKKFAVLGNEFTIEGGELTPTLKVKRRVVEDRYRDVLDQLYTEG